MAGWSGATPPSTRAGTVAPVPYTWFTPQRPYHEPSASCWSSSQAVASRPRVLEPAQGEHDLGGVVHVGVVDVGELEGPPAGRQLRPADRPVAAAADLLVQQPVAGGQQRGVVALHAGVGEGDDRQRGVP